MVDPQKLLDQFLGSQSAQGKPGISPDLLKGGAIGGIAGLLLGSKAGRKLAGSAVKMGGLAVLGGIAYKVWSDWQAGKHAPQDAPAGQPRDITPRAGDPQLLPDGKVSDKELSRVLLTAMISAAKADGHIDAAEQTRIFRKLDESKLSAEEKGFLFDEIRKPIDLDSLAAQATTPELALEIYAASLLAIDTEGSTEREYLSALAQKLKLDPLLAARIEKETEAVAA